MPIDPRLLAAMLQQRQATPAMPQPQPGLPPGMPQRTPMMPPGMAQPMPAATTAAPLQAPRQNFPRPMGPQRLY